MGTGSRMGRQKNKGGTVIGDLLEVWSATKVPATQTQHACKYCSKTFVKESTLFSHLCEAKRRALQEKETGVQWGFRAYLDFYQSTQLSSKPKAYQDFCDSPYYIAFVKYGRYCVSVRCPNYQSYTQWLLRNNKKIDKWTSDSIYDKWLYDHIKQENVQDALERGIKEMTAYAETNPDLKNGYVDYFRYSSANRIIHAICTGQISPWIVYNCDSGVKFLNNLTEEQVNIVVPWIDPDYWNKTFKDNVHDQQWAKTILGSAGL
jgi:hypothetical protein